MRGGKSVVESEEAREKHRVKSGPAWALAQALALSPGEAQEKHQVKCFRTIREDDTTSPPKTLRHLG
ncbi:hypothetical protein L195_g034199 [Trifolium pratense]|uniref:Uncharacterized protein n=1 Tax=Trifolium pratense TaxID=57577 RepID=A0A2K3LI66_TRIPR|nr:hypothetical protein L195_g034199 [Trifolium pratense]